MLSQTIDGLPRGGFETGLISIGNNLTTLLLKNRNPQKDLSSGKLLRSVRISVSVSVCMLFSLAWASSAIAVEPIKRASPISGETLSLQASEQGGDPVSSESKAELETRQLIRDRIVGLAIVFFGLLSLLGLSFIYLRLDHATRGFHSGRLQLLGVFLGLIIVGICYFFLNQIVLSSP
jgi:hypothetical protein